MTRIEEEPMLGAAPAYDVNDMLDLRRMRCGAFRDFAARS
jgi:hypothetical protein